MRQVKTIQEQPRPQWGKLFLLATDVAAVAWLVYVGLQISGI